jgi:hypothetical protein
MHNLSIKLFTIFRYGTRISCELGSSVSIASDYGLDGLGIECRWSEIFRTPHQP